MQGKVCLVTGATSGIGLVTARELTRRGAHVVLVGRSPVRCEAAVQLLQEHAAGGKVEALLADLSSLEQVRSLARQFHERHHRLDVLLNNAGGMWLRRELTADGLEMTFAVNHLAYFVLTHLLLDSLKAAAPSRIVNVSSGAHRKAMLDFGDLQGERRYGGWRQYCRSKLMNLLFTYALARRLSGTGVTVNAMHPGWVATGFAGNNGWRGRGLQLLARWFGLSPEEGARTVVYLATSPEVADISGKYFVHERPVLSSAASYDEAAQERLWHVSLELSGPAAPSGKPHFP
jgi:NAD(P)-dependent dehydrogenase (short-subunit alcohol dehydrogenase family)